MIISHRGNILGPNPTTENHPDQIQKALNQGYDVEIDLWFKNNKFILGHDEPQYEISEYFFHSPKFWIHAKNVETLIKLHSFLKFASEYQFQYFYHQNDDIAMTSGGYLWTFPRPLSICSKSIVCLPERLPGEYDLHQAAGICTDYPEFYRKYKDL